MPGEASHGTMGSQHNWQHLIVMACRTVPWWLSTCIFQMNGA